MSWNRPKNFAAKQLLNGTVAALALLGACGVANAQAVGTDAADEDQAGASTASNVIVVTARRVDEDVQDIPISVGVLGEADLAAKDISDFQDLKGAVVGLTTSRTSTAGGGYVTIRGITAIATPQPASDQGVGFFIDGVYIARSQGAGAPLVDVQRVEVLRGPQGTLFGRNSSTGAINFITNKPVDYFTASASASYGNYNEIEAQAMINIPITPDLIARFAVKHREIEGDVKNTYAGPGLIYNDPDVGRIEPVGSFGFENSESYLARLRFTGIDGVTVDYKYDREEVRATPGPNQILGFAPNNAFGAVVGNIFQINRALNPGGVNVSGTRLSSVSAEHASLQTIDNDGHMLDIDIELGDSMNLRSITAYRTTKSKGATDLDGSSFVLPFPFPIVPNFFSFGAGAFCLSCSTNTLDQHAWSQELQLVGSTGGLDYVLGAYYFDEHARFKNTYAIYTSQPLAPATYTPNPNFANPIGLPGDYVLGNDGIYDNASYALYGHLDYEFSEAFDISLGLRHTWDKRRTNDMRAFGSGLSKLSDSRFTYDAALNFHPSQDVLLFAKYARGYVSGGIDSNITFRPEIHDQVEVGFKGEFLDRTLTVNASLYYSWIEDRQATLPSTSPTPCNPVLAAAGFTAPCPVGLFVYNLPGTSKVKGFELETVMRPTEGLTFTANLSVNDPSPSTGELPRAPKLNMAFSAQYDFPAFSNGSYLTARIDADYRDEYYATGGNAPTSFTGTVDPLLRNGVDNTVYLAALKKASLAGDYFLVNGRVALAQIPIAGAKVEISGYVRNLLDTQKALFTVNYGSHYSGSFERPRTYGVRLAAEF